MTPIPGSGSDTSCVSLTIFNNTCSLLNFFFFLPRHSSIKSLGSRSNFSRMGNGSSKTLAPLQEVEPVKVAFLVRLTILTSEIVRLAAELIPPSAFSWQCEQVSHHPPISSAYYYCPSKGIEAYGVSPRHAVMLNDASDSCFLQTRSTKSLQKSPA